MKILQRIKSGHYNRVYEVEYEGKVAIAKLKKPTTLVTTNLDVFLGNTIHGDNRSYNTPTSRHKYEKKRLRELYQRGANVPQILYEGDGYFIMEKLPGETLDELFGHPSQYNAIIVAFAQLRVLHDELRVYHGSTHPRNVIINGRGASWVDWETLLKGGSLKSNQRRDIKILYHDLVRKLGLSKRLQDSIESSYPAAIPVISNDGLTYRPA